MLGRLYEELPWFLGGDQEAAGEHLKQAVLLDRLYVLGHLDLGRWYLKQGYHHDAVQEFTWVVETPPCENVWIWERMHRPQAQELLRQLTILEGRGIVPEGSLENVGILWLDSLCWLWENFPGFL